MAKVYKKVTKKLDSLTLDEFETSVDNIIQMLQRFQEKYSAWTLYLEEDYGYYEGDEGDSNSFYIMGHRLETDTERSKRIATARKVSAAKMKRREEDEIKREEEEKKYYEKLKAKYG